MAFLIVVNNPNDWHLKIPGVDVISAKTYLTDSRYSETSGTKVFNLCRSYRYQSSGYYVSLLASARGHKPIPNVVTLRDMTSPAVTRLVSEDLEQEIQRNLKGIQSPTFSLSIYLGKNLAKKYDRLSLKLFNMFEAPLLRADFAFEKKWELKHIRPIAASEIPDAHHDFVVNRAIEYFSNRRALRHRRGGQKYDLAILHDPAEENPPSDKRALKAFARAGAAIIPSPAEIGSTAQAVLRKLGRAG